MKIADSNNQKYASYKNNLIFESIISTPDRDRFYGLSREHIELTLGIKIPLLLESIDFKLEDKILREQYLFEQWAQSLRTAAGAAGGAVKTAAGVVGGAVKTAAKAVTLGKVRDTAGIFKALSIIVRYPTLVKELGDSLSDYVTKLLRPVVGLLELVIKWVKDKANKLLVAINTTFTAAKNTIQSLLTRFSSLAGWQKVALGAGLAILGAWVSSIIGPKIEILTGKLTKAIGEVGSKVVDVGKKVAGAAVDATVAAAKPEFGEDRGALAVGKALTGSALEDPLTELGKEILPELQALATTVLKKLALPTTLATLSLFAGPLGPFLLGVGTLVAKSSLIITTLAPITNGFIDKYNAIIGNKPAGQLQSSAERRRGRELGPSTTPTFDAAAARIGAAAGAVRSRAAAGIGAVRSAVGLEEHRVLLRDIIYE